jgi:ribosomal protein S18 acetylase RimI-like enzyme
MFKFYQDSFDTRILGKSAYKLIIPAEGISSERLASLLSEIEKPSMICCFTPYDPLTVELLYTSGFRFISTKNVYIKKTDATSLEAQTIYGSFKLVRLSKDELGGHQLDFSRMVSTIAAKGRYSKDIRIPEDKPLMVYREWINNSIHNSFADEVMILLSDQTIAGMITLKIREENGTIDLIIVDPAFQGMGIGKRLLTESQQYFSEIGAKALLVETEAENIGSNIFYQRNGFILQDFQLVFHKHITE